MEELMDCLEKKAKNEKNQMLSAVFLLNNYYHIEKIVKLSEELSSIFEGTFIADIDKTIDLQIAYYRSLFVFNIYLLFIIYI